MKTTPIKPDANGFVRHCNPACALWRVTGSFSNGEWLKGRCAGENPSREIYAHVDGHAGHVCLVDDDMYDLLPSQASMVSG